MASKSVDDTVEQMRVGNEISFTDLYNVCKHYFGASRIKGSHHIFKTPWPGDPRINIRSTKGKAKAYPVKQVLAAIEKLADLVLAAAKAKAEKADAEKKRKKK